MGFARWLNGKESACQGWRHGFDPWVGEDLLEEEMANHSSILAWRIPMDRGAWQAIVHGVTKSQARLSMHACEKGPIAFISCEPEKITQEFQNPITMKAVTVKPCKLAFWVKDNTKTLLLAAVGAKVCRKEHLPSLPRAAPPQIHLFISERTATPCGHFSVQRLAALVFHYLKNHQIGVFVSHFPSSHCTGEQRKQL